MPALKEHLDKFREERIVREKARIQQLRELNLRKYNANDSKASNQSMSAPHVIPVVPSKQTSCLVKSAHSEDSNRRNIKPKPSKLPTVAYNVHKDLNNLTKRHIKVPVEAVISSTSNESASNLKPKTVWKSHLNHVQIGKNDKLTEKVDIQPRVPKNPKNMEKKRVSGTVRRAKWGNPTINLTIVGKPITDVHAKDIPQYKKNSLAPVCVDSVIAISAKNVPKLMTKSSAPRFSYQKPITNVTNPTSKPIKTMQPRNISQSSKAVNDKRQSVFERLYQPKIKPKPVKNDAEILKNYPTSNKLLKNKHDSVFEQYKTSDQPARRSISAVHFKRISKNELANCIHKWSSVDNKLDKVSLQNINEDENVSQDRIVSAVKSERHKVKFQAPVANFNTPKPNELQKRLQNWLKKRGKSLDSYHHLQCFGIDHLAQEIRPLNLEKVTFVPEANVTKPMMTTSPVENSTEGEDKFESFEDDNKENEPLASDSDNDSYNDNMCDRVNDLQIQYSRDKWRKASFVDSVDLNETQDTTLTMNTDVGSEGHVEDVVAGALNDLTEILKEGFDWEQSASWLRAIRQRFPNASDTAAYWECRAALEETRGDFPASIQCWEQAIAKGTKHSVMEANLDQLLNKFMQLKISPTSGSSRQPDSKILDVKNVFKSTLVRFAVQQAKSRQSKEPNLTVTPVRRSARLSNTGQCSAKHMPLRVCTTVKQARLLGHSVEFVPNDKLAPTP